MQIKDHTALLVGLLFLTISLLTGGIIYYIALVLVVLIIAIDYLWLMYLRFTLSRNLVIHRRLSRHDILFGTSSELVTTIDYSGRRTRHVPISQPFDTAITVLTPVPDHLDFFPGGHVHLNFKLKPVQTGELYIEPLHLVIESTFFRHDILIGKKERLVVHIGIGSAEIRSGAPSSGSKKYSDFILSKFSENRGSTDFSTIRNYSPGDDAKNIDWMRSAKAGTLLVREYEEDRPMPVFFIIDVDSSMGTGAPSSELASAINLTALIINRLTTESNMFGIACFSRNDIVKYRSLGIGRDHLSKIKDILTELRPESGASRPFKSFLSLQDASSQKNIFRTTAGLEVLGSVLDETILEYSVNVNADGFVRAVVKASRSIGTPCQIVVMTNLSMGLPSLMNGIRMAKYYGHSVSIVLTPHIWFDGIEFIDSETCYDKYQLVKGTISSIRGAGSIKVIDFSSSDRPEDAIYRNSTYRQSVGLRRW